MKKGICRFLVGILLGTVFLWSANPVAAEGKTEDEFQEMTAEEIVKDMGAGWNLGNTMDGHVDLTPGETAWQGVETTQELIKSVHDMGFQTIRIPVTWGTMIDDANGYAIDETWLKRVQEIVDYAMREGMYAIINVHHDGATTSYWLNGLHENMNPVYEKFGGVWTHIAEWFQSYDEHLIFEGMNEVSGGAEEIAKLNQTFVDAVRATGGNNARRWLSVPGAGANIASASLDFAFPKDTIENRLFFAVHYYDWNFGLQESTDMTEWNEGDTGHLYEQLKYLRKFFTKRGIPVILGEYGSVDKNNTADRAYANEATARMCRNMGVVPIYWDNGYHDDSKEVDYGFSLINRETGEAWYPEIVQAIMRGAYLDGPYEDVVKNPEIIKAERLSVSREKVTMKAGESVVLIAVAEPQENNDVVLWKSEDESVATVFNGKICAVGDGQTEVVAFSQSGSAQCKVAVQVGEIAKEQDAAQGKQEGKNSFKVAGLLAIALGTICMLVAGIQNNRRKMK